MTSIEIPNSVTSIGNCAFGACDNLLSIFSLIENPYNITDDVFHLWDNHSWTSYFDSNKTLYVPKGTKSLYEACEGWKLFTNIIELETDGIRNVEKGVEEQTTTCKDRYDLNGRRISEPQRGLNILRMSDGTVRKVVIK
ncbi:MAG: hypothetical protein IJS97_09745 [Prevotella sp.]|nr:hypothetical protein [Prevotella sp.]